MKFGQLIESNIRSIFTQKSWREWERRTSSRLLFVIKKSSICGKSNWSGAWFQYFLIALNLTYNKNKLYKTVDYWLRDIIAFGFLEKGLRIVFAPHVVMTFQEKCFLCYILLTDQISLSLLREIFSNMCIAIFCFPGCEIYGFLTKPFFYMTKNPKQKIIYLENKKSF